MVCGNKIKTIIIFLLALYISSFSSELYAQELANIKSLFLKIISSVNKQDIFKLEKRSPITDVSPRASFQMADSLTPNAVQSYFPLNNNDEKNYEGELFGTIYHGTYNYSQVYFNGNTCFLEHDSLDDSKAYYRHSGSNLYMDGISFGYESLPFNNPLIILNDSILNNGGSLQSNTTLSVEGYLLEVQLTMTASNIGSVSIPLGTVDNCRSIDMSFVFSVQGESETIDINDAWVLAPNIGKLRIGLMDQFGNQRGWMDLTGGTVAGQDISEIMTPIIAEFEADLIHGFSPLTVQFTDLSSGSINSWYWDFGDGTISTEQNPSKTYNEPGIYTVSLTVTGPGGSHTETNTDYIEVSRAGKAMPWIPLLLFGTRAAPGLYDPVGVWNGTIYDTTIGGSGTIENWELKENNTMLGNWIFYPGIGGVISLNIGGSYSFDTNEISFNTTGLATYSVSGSSDSVSNYTLTVNGSMTSSTAAEGTYSVDFTDPMWPDNSGSWSITKTAP